LRDQLQAQDFASSGFKQGQKFRQFIVDDSPDHLKIKRVVFMDDDIAHAGHFLLRNVGMLLTQGGVRRLVASPMLVIG
jgi:hypothetical protein